MKLQAGFFILLLLMSRPLGAQTIIECGSSQGKAFYYGIDQETQKQIGWVDDGIAEGGIVLVRSGDALDIIMKDAVGTMSHTAEGASVSLIDWHEPFVEVLVSYPMGTKELYTFDLKERRVAWSQHKFGGPLDKAQTFVADCK